MNTKPSSNNILKEIGAGISSGIFGVILFNPVDRALYLHTLHNRPFFNKENWKNPYKGVNNATLQRIFSYGLFFTITDNVKLHIKNVPLAFGISSIITSCCIAPFSAIKNYYWNVNYSTSMVNFIPELYKIHGIKIFFRAMHILICRDFVFGYTMGYLRHNYNRTNSKINNLAFISFATILSSPLNYLRIMKFTNENKSCAQITKELHNFVCTTMSDKNIFQKTFLVFRYKFRVGLGTLRVAIGMIVGDYMYQSIVQNMR